jgi:hypothetical protein
MRRHRCFLPDSLDVGRRHGLVGSARRKPGRQICGTEFESLDLKLFLAVLDLGGGLEVELAIHAREVGFPRQTGDSLGISTRAAQGLR